jgi:hypothetical protein
MRLAMTGRIRQASQRGVWFMSMKARLMRSSTNPSPSPRNTTKRVTSRDDAGRQMDRLS